MSHAICAPACALFDLPDVHVLAVERGPHSFTLVVETVATLVGCPSCAVLATGHGRRQVLLHDLPCAGAPVRVRWRKRIYRCLEDACDISTFSEIHSLAALGPSSPAARSRGPWPSCAPMTSRCLGPG
ncbi:transposase family protein [Kocuria sp. CCUG 69068]|uniref:transposase family protein n=1 Tax=Kocuria sp. CCUG 69068 TaxID=2043138 RepID=UPI00351D91E4